MFEWANFHLKFKKTSIQTATNNLCFGQKDVIFMESWLCWCQNAIFFNKTVQSCSLWFVLWFFKHFHLQLKLLFYGWPLLWKQYSKLVLVDSTLMIPQSIEDFCCAISLNCWTDSCTFFMYFYLKVWNLCNISFLKCTIWAQNFYFMSSN